MGMAPDNEVQEFRSHAQIAWAAGLFEGEGSIQIRNGGVRLVVRMTDRDVVERLAQSAQCGGAVRCRPPSLKPHHQTQWRWGCSVERDVVRLLNEWMPFFGKRRSARAREALEVLSDENKLERVCWCGKPFLTRRPIQFACCESHRAIWKYEQRKLEATNG